MKIYSSLVKDMKEGKKKFAILIDPDKNSSSSLKKIVTLSSSAGVDYFLFGGSLLTRDNQDQLIRLIRENCTIPVILFPGNTFQVNKSADAILFLSLISGRNPELLIGKHVIAAPFIKESNLEVIPTGYMLIDGGRITTVAYMSNTVPIPSDKTDIAICTAMAGEMLGLKTIYMDAGSGAGHTVPADMIRQVKASVSCPLFVGGGIRDPKTAATLVKAGADVVVVGNILEKDPSLIGEISDSIHN